MRSIGSIILTILSRRKLDSLFKVTSKVIGERGDISGLIGIVRPCNEPSHHIAYLFNSGLADPMSQTKRLIDQRNNTADVLSQIR